MTECSLEIDSDDKSIVRIVSVPTQSAIASLHKTSVAIGVPHITRKTTTYHIPRTMCDADAGADADSLHSWERASKRRATRLRSYVNDSFFPKAAAFVVFTFLALEKNGPDVRRRVCCYHPYTLISLTSSLRSVHHLPVVNRTTLSNNTLRYPNKWRRTAAFLRVIQYGNSFAPQRMICMT